ncbi:MAG: flagellar protein [Treponema sp.]|nr:MAG: flagellar protein [Treponema sp.]
MLNDLRQADLAAEITSASSKANMPAKVKNLSSGISGDYISSMKINNPTPADKQAAAKGDAAKSIMANNTKVDKTSKLYEKSLELESYFVKIMLNTMRKTLTGSSLGDNSYASKMYKDMMYDELSRTVTKNAGFGLADQIYLQLKNS